MADRFVLDASVTIRWALQDGSIGDRAYAYQVLDSFAVARATVAPLWYTEIIHVVRCAEDNGTFGKRSRRRCRALNSS